MHRLGASTLLVWMRNPTRRIVGLKLRIGPSGGGAEFVVGPEGGS